MEIFFVVKEVVAEWAEASLLRGRPNSVRFPCQDLKINLPIPSLSRRGEPDAKHLLETAEPIKLPDHQRVVRVQRLETRFQSWPVPTRPTLTLE
jgi:hypothetical protein